jgi:PAS domain S-box-containing protein
MHDDLRQAEERFRLLVESVRDYAIFMLDPEGRIMSWNAGAENIKGYKAEEIIGRHFSTFYPPEAIARGWPEYELKVARKEGRFEDEGWRLRKDGTSFWANVVITALRDKTGTLQGFAKVTRDLTERQMQQEFLRESEERFRLLVESIRDYALFMLDPDGRIVSWNAGARALKGYRAEEVLGRHFSLFYPPDDIARGWPEHELEVAKREGRFEDEGWRIRKDGSRFWANVIITALYDEERRLRGFAKITRDLTDRKRVERLEESERQMSEFLAMLAHELRNPLAPIRSALGAMQMRGQDESTLERSRNVIDRQITHLTRLVDDLLDVSRITRGKITLQKEPLELARLLTDVVESSRSLIDARRHTFEVVFPDKPLWVEGDAIRLSQIVLNLLNNAAKFTPEGGRIRLTLEKENGDAAIRVRDTGVGIPADLLPKIFDIFTQGAHSLDRSEGGLGIGLTLVHRLVALHGGTVRAHSPGPNRGSEFVIRIPLLNIHTLPEERYTPGRDLALSPPTAARRVLVVDDNEDAAETMAILFQFWGHEVRTAYDGPSALSLAAEYRPEIVLLDIGLPGISGYEVAQQLRKMPGLETVTIVAVTGYGQEEDRRRALEAGFNSYLVKPVEPAELQSLIASVPAPRRS